MGQSPRRTVGIMEPTSSTTTVNAVERLRARRGLWLEPADLFDADLAATNPTAAHLRGQHIVYRPGDLVELPAAAQ